MLYQDLLSGLNKIVKGEGQIPLRVLCNHQLSVTLIAGLVQSPHKRFPTPSDTQLYPK